MIALIMTNRQQAGYGVNDFSRYEGSASLTGLTTSLVLGNAFDKNTTTLFPQGL